MVPDTQQMAAVPLERGIRRVAFGQPRPVRGGHGQRGREQQPAHAARRQQRQRHRNGTAAPVRIHPHLPYPGCVQRLQQPHRPILDRHHGAFRLAQPAEVERDRQGARCVQHGQHRSRTSRHLADQQQRIAFPRPGAAHQPLVTGDVHEIRCGEPGDGSAGRCGRHRAKPGMAVQQRTLLHRGGERVRRQFGPPGIRRRAVPHHVDQVARARPQAHRRGHALQPGQAVVPECGGVADAVAVPRLLQLDHAAVDERQRRSVPRRPAGGAPVEPRPERMLVAVAEPRPQQVAAVPTGLQRRQVGAEHLGTLLRRPDRVAVGQHHRAQRRVAPGEIDRDGGAGVPPIHRRRPDPERLDRRGQGVRIILDLRRPAEGERFRQPIARRVERNGGEIPREHRLRQPHLAGRGGRGVQQQDRRPLPHPRVVHAPGPRLRHGCEVAVQTHQAAARAEARQAISGWMRVPNWSMPTRKSSNVSMIPATPGTAANSSSSAATVA